MSLVRFGLFGSSGRMGQAIMTVAEKNKDLEFTPFSLDMGDKQIQVIIDFSSPKGTLDVAEWCKVHKKPLVSGTTGLSSEQIQTLHEVSKEVAILWSPNMSIGLNAMAEALATFIKKFPALKISSEEIHHIHKKDKPSGTAKFLQTIIKENATSKTLIEEPHSVREGEVFGIHSVKIEGLGEEITFRHEAQSREIFALGALRAAQWIVHKKAGFYSMKDVLL